MNSKGWLVTWFSNLTQYLRVIPSVWRLLILVAVLLTLGAIPTTHKLALWIGGASLLLAIIYGI